MEFPRDYHLPSDHNEWRPYQYDTVQWCLNLSGLGLLEAPTGSGKTAYARAASSCRKTLAICKTKTLQVANYRDRYDMDIIMGKSNYPCVHPKAKSDMTAEHCIHQENMYDCPNRKECPYLVQKMIVLGSQKACANYAYFLSTRVWKENPPPVLFLDECHLLPDIVLDWVGITLSDRDIKEWLLPSLPYILSDRNIIISGRPKPSQIALGWLAHCQKVLDLELISLRKHISPENLTLCKRLAQCEHLSRAIESTINALTLKSTDWYISAGPSVIRNKYPGFVAKPLTARYDFNRLFAISPTVIAMSATVGNMQTFARELGIKDYEGRVVPNQWPPETRPVLALDVPKLSHKSTEKEYEKQADEMSKIIRSVDPKWTGIIHVTRKNEASLLANRLAKRGLQDRVWVTPDVSTNQQMAAWHETKKKSNGIGKLAISWSWHEGVDLTEESICISSKIGFADISDSFERERMYFDGGFYRQRAAWDTMQSLGRTRRGEEEDYDLAGNQNQLVAMADGHWRTIKKYLANDFREAIVEV